MDAPRPPGLPRPASLAPRFIHPWMTDERRYPIVSGLGDNGMPSVRWLLRREFPRSVVRSKWGHAVFTAADERGLVLLP